MSAVLNWYANPTGAKGMRNYRIYTAKTWGEPLRSFRGTDNAVGGASERHDSSRSYVFVGAGTIDPVLDAAHANPDVEEGALPKVHESHQFFSYFFPGHAIGHSDIF